MGLFRRGVLKNVYQPLYLPRLGDAPLPSADALMHKGMPIIDVIKKAAYEYLSGAGPVGIETQYPDLRQLRLQLIDAFAIDQDSMTKTSRAALAWLLSAGWMVGELENQSGVSKTGLSEGHYWSAMVFLQVDLDRSDMGRQHLTDSSENGGFSPMQEAFSLMASYYVARTGSNSIDQVVAACKAT